MLKLLTGIALLVFWIGFFIAGVTEVNYVSGGDGTTTTTAAAAATKYTATVQMVLDVTYASVLADPTNLMKNVVTDVEKALGDASKATTRSVEVLQDGGDATGTSGTTTTADGGTAGTTTADGGSTTTAAATTTTAATTQVMQLCNSGTVPLVCTERAAILTLTGITTTTAAAATTTADGGAATTATADGGAAAPTTTADGAAATTATADGGAATTADGDGRAASTLAAGDLVVRIDFESTSVAGAREGAERAAAVIDGQWQTITFSGRRIIAAGRPRVVAAPAEGAPTSVVFMEVQTPTELAAFWESPELLTSLTAIEAEVKARYGSLFFVVLFISILLIAEYEYFDG